MKIKELKAAIEALGGDHTRCIERSELVELLCTTQKLVKKTNGDALRMIEDREAELGQMEPVPRADQFPLHVQTKSQEGSESIDTDGQTTLPEPEDEGVHAGQSWKSRGRPVNVVERLSLIHI